MRIERVNCRNFRNLENCNVYLDSKVNVFVGKNGQGKTNFLESIYYLSTTRSFRINKDQDCIKHGSQLAKIECILNDEEIVRHLSCVIHDKGKSCFISNQQIPKTSEFIGKCNAILFAPTDLEIFTASPKLRRKLMDVEIGKVNRSYSIELNRYNKLMKDRNASLKQDHIDDVYLDVIDQQMAETSIGIIKKRKDFISFINERLSLRYHDLSNEEAVIECHYKTILEDSELSQEKILEKLKNNRQKDWFLKVTSFGIHRDDLLFTMNSKLLDNVASQGQRRMVVLGLKMAFVDYAIEKTKKKPILLLDDVLSELDIEKRKNLFNTIPEGIQTFITTTEINEVVKELRNKPKIFKVSKGLIEEI